MSTAEPESPVLKTPEWLDVLENKRKRPHKLAHEIGAGAPCLICKEGCKGLNLHFWRKLCIECKCRKEDHEVQEEEDYAQFEILFGAKKVKRTTLKFNAQNKSFDWIPPNVPTELAVDYLKSIPQSKLPISNSEGARYRKQQLEKQLPLHDVDPNACHNLTDKEMQEFEKYLANLKDNVIGQGIIMKYQSPQALKENRVPISTLNMTCREEYPFHKPLGAELKGHVVVDKLPGATASSQPLNTELYPAKDSHFIQHHKYSEPVNLSTISGLHPLKTFPLEKNHNYPPGKSLDSNFTAPKPFFPSTDFQKDGTLKQNTQGFNNNNQKFNLGLRTPSSFISKNFPAHDKQNNNEFLHRDDNCNEKAREFPSGGAFQNSNLSFPGNSAAGTLLSGVGENPPIPYDASFCKVPLAEFEQLNVSSSDVPYAVVQETGNIKTPNKQVQGITATQKENNLLPSEESLEFPVPPATCQQCLEILNPEEVVVQTERGGSLALWHAKCFVCETCKELLVDLMYFFHKGKVYCGRHYAEMMSIPRCHACDELIFVKEYTCAEGESYHVRHFCCFHCDQPLGGKQYISKENQPICLNCYQVKYGKTCRTCGQPIGAGEQRVSWKDLDFHVYPECFRCAKCLKSLLGGKFMCKDSNTFCSKECVQEFTK